ncbi:copper resistance protein CopB [Phenylobacterium hankyongense]|uniref:Copper resistance protein CopB n=2 Tax=Phenylobacterium hankyongense TaxID=1813876 RepID=A0A328B9T5_9CAUL|nr:copper resistance protein CopB [Phenylobacterium hankyongense]
MDPNMPGMDMSPAKPKPAVKAAPKTPGAKARKPPAKAATTAPPTGAHDTFSMPGMAMPGMAMPAKPPAGPAGAMPGMAQAPGAAPSAAPSMPGMDMSKGATPEAEAPIPQTPPPPAPTDHAADRYYDPASMAAARQVLRMEHGGMAVSQVMADIAEFQAGSGGGYRWEGQAWYGGDINRLVAKSEGEGTRRDGLDSAELQLLYARAVSPYVDLQAGVRQDFAPHARTYLAVGAQSLLPYWFDVEGAVFLSDKGEVLGRVDGYYDLRLTQRLVLQPRAEFNLAVQDTPETRTGSGLSDAALDLRLRYEIRHDFAPYVGVSYQRRFGKTADYARLAGQGAESTSFVVGLRAWF